MFERGMYLSVFYFLCYVKEISVYMLEEQVSEEKYPDLNEEEYIRFEYSRDEHRSNISEDGDDKKNIHSLRWDIYKKDN